MSNPFSSITTDLLIRLALPIISSYLIVPAMDMLKRASTWLDSQNGAVKNALVFVIAAIANGLAQVVGSGIPTDIHDWNDAVIKTILTWALAAAIKRKQQVTQLSAADPAQVPRP